MAPTLTLGCAPAARVGTGRVPLAGFPGICGRQGTSSQPRSRRNHSASSRAGTSRDRGCTEGDRDATQVCDWRGSTFAPAPVEAAPLVEEALVSGCAHLARVSSPPPCARERRSQLRWRWRPRDGCGIDPSRPGGWDQVMATGSGAATRRRSSCACCASVRVCARVHVDQHDSSHHPHPNVSASSSDGAITRAISNPRARAMGHGTAFPACRYLFEAVPLSCSMSGNP